jgi:D-alanine-D-alanine ligase
MSVPAHSHTHVAVVMGGWSAEREVSLVTGKSVVKALRDLAYRVTEIDAGRNLSAVLSALRPDVVFNALHGRFGEDGTVQGLLEILGIPYTHSGVRASALAMHKPTARDIFAAAGLRCPEGCVVSREEILCGPVMDTPFVVKPLDEGSSVGVTLVFEGETYQPNDTLGDEVLVERYIPGREIQVAVMDGRALGAIEVQPTGRFYDYETKYVDGLAKHVMPAELPPADYQKALDISAQAHRILGCRGVTRADLRCDDTSGGYEFYLLEVNTQPGLTPLSLVPEVAAAGGIPFEELIGWMVEDAGLDR